MVAQYCFGDDKSNNRNGSKNSFNSFLEYAI